MLHHYLLAAQIVTLAITGILLWQIWHFLKRTDLPEDEPLGEQGAHYLTRRLTVIMVCAIIEAALTIAQVVLRII